MALRIGALCVDNSGRGSVVCYADALETRKSIQHRKRGRFLYNGLWYGSNPLEVSSYGKFQGRPGVNGSHPVGKARSKHQVLKFFNLRNKLRK